MAQETQTGALDQPRGVRWGGEVIYKETERERGNVEALNWLDKNNIYAKKRKGWRLRALGLHFVQNEAR